MNLGDPLTTQAQVKTALGWGAGVTGYDDRIGIGILLASDRIADYCEREYLVNSSTGYITEYHDGDGQNNYFFTEEYPIQDVSGLWDDTDREYGSGDEVSSDEFVFYTDTGKVARVDSTDDIRTGHEEPNFAAGQKNIKIVYAPGFDSLPKDLEYAAILLVVSFLNRIKSTGLSQTALGAASSVIDPNEMPVEAKSILRRYRKLNT